MTAPSCVDIHAHFMPPSLLADARAGTAIDGLRLRTDDDGREWLHHGQGARFPVRSEMVDPQRRLELMDASTVDIQVVSLAPPFAFYWIDAATAVDWAQRANEELADLVRAAAGRIIGIGTLPIQDPAAAVAEIRRIRAAGLPLSGFQIPPMVDDRTLDEPELAEVLAELDRDRRPVILHPYFVGARPRPGLDKYHLTNLIGHPYQTAVGAARLVLSGTFDRLPNLTPVLVHGGGYLPYQMGRLDHGWRVRADVRGCAQEPSSYLRRFRFDTLTHSTAALAFLLEAAGPDRVCFGTDFPADMSDGDLTEQLAGLDLTPADRGRIAGANALDLFTQPAMVRS